MLYTGVKLLCNLTFGLLFSAVAVASTPLDHKTELPNIKVAPSTSTPSWQEAGSSRFYSSAQQASFTLDTPQSFSEIKFVTDKPLKVETAALYTESGQLYKVPFQQSVPNVETVARPLPKSVGAIQKVTVFYKDPGKHQGTIRMEGRQTSEEKP